MAAWIGTDKAAFVIEKLETAHRTKFPPVILFFFFWRFGSIHDGSSIMILLVIELTSIDKPFLQGGHRVRLIIYHRETLGPIKEFGALV